MAEPLVLLPAMMCDARLFWPQIMAFGSERSICLPPITIASSVGALAAAVLDGAPQRFALVGAAMGGMVAMEVLRRAPERVTRLALMDTNCMAETPAAAASREPRVVAAQSGRLNDVIREEIKLRDLAAGPRRRDAMALFLEMGEDLGPQVYISQTRALQRRPDQQKTLLQCRVPTLILCGEQDMLCPVARHEFMAEMIPQAELVVVREAGHLPTLEQPEAVNEALRTWLSTPLVLR